MAPINFSKDENDFELDININDLNEMNEDDYLKKNLKISKQQQKVEQEKRLEIISRIVESWKFLDEHDRKEIIEIAELMRQGKWVKGSIKQLEIEIIETADLMRQGKWVKGSIQEWENERNRPIEEQE